MRDNLSRRRVLIGTGAAATGALSGIVLTTQNASATVDGEFAIPNGETVLADATLEDIRLSVDVNWSYESNADINATELELYIGETADTADLIARQEKDDIGTDSLTGETTLNGSLMSASDFRIDDFQPSGGELRRSVVAELRFYTLRNEEVVAEARQQTTFDVVIRNEELTVDMTMNASGEVEFSTSEG